MPESDILEISSPFATDFKITKIDYHSYTPNTTSFKNDDEIQSQVSNAGKVKLTNNDSTPVLGITRSLKGYLSGTPDNYNCYESAVNSRLGLIITRSHSDLNALKVITSGSTISGKVILNKIVWKVPHITVDDVERLKLLKLIEQEKSLFIPFRSFETFEYPELETTKKVVWNLKTASN
ncbi:Uncharacterized protein FWK35_00035474 [Aphis craccivora]|uniref:Double jelly roll-like domain-containing protein n=1 Tax=Aphis craccivora TaxID=307492 RepID=A0A6G0VL77_APHCR|nr:Uncharacterized protein FWK35_00035474 [Aphis craccivora]